MIARMWHGWTRPENAGAYETLLRTQILPGIRKAAGCQGIRLLRRGRGDEVEFVTMLFFDSLEAVKAWAGPNYDDAVIPPEAKALLKRFRERSRHYDAVVQL